MKGVPVLMETSFLFWVHISHTRGRWSIFLLELEALSLGNSKWVGYQDALKMPSPENKTPSGLSENTMAPHPADSRPPVLTSLGHAQPPRPQEEQPGEKGRDSGK